METNERTTYTSLIWGKEMRRASGGYLEWCQRYWWWMVGLSLSSSIYCSGLGVFKDPL